MANPNRVAGQARVKVDGQILETDGTSTMELGGKVREPVQGDYQAGSFKEMTKEAKLDATILIKAGTTVAQLRDIDNATVTLENDIGQTWVIRNAWCADVISIATNDGKAKVVFMGPPAEELSA